MPAWRAMEYFEQYIWMMWGREGSSKYGGKYGGTTVQRYRIQAVDAMIGETGVRGKVHSETVRLGTGSGVG